MLCYTLNSAERSNSLEKSLESFICRLALGSLIGVNYTTATIDRLLPLNGIHILHKFVLIGTGFLMLSKRFSFELMIAISCFLYAMITIQLSRWFTKKRRKISWKEIDHLKGNYSMISLVGSKMLTILCCHLPFFYTKAMLFYSKHTETTQQYFNQLIFLLCVRLFIGTISIFSKTCFKKIHSLGVVWLALFIISRLIILFQQHGHAFNYIFAVNDCDKVIFLTLIYVGISLFIDVFELSQTFIKIDENSSNKLQSILMSSCAEHLFNVFLFLIYRYEIIDISFSGNFLHFFGYFITVKCIYTKLLKRICCCIEHLMKLQIC